MGHRFHLKPELAATDGSRRLRIVLLGRTQRELGQVAGIAPNAIGAYARDERLPEPENRTRLDQACGIPTGAWDAPNLSRGAVPVVAAVDESPPPTERVPSVAAVLQLRPEPPQAWQPPPAVEGGGRPTTALERVDGLLRSLQMLIDDLHLAAAGSASIKDRLACLRAMTGPIRLLAMLTGEAGATDATVASSPFYQRVRDAVVDALRPHPDAARAVIAALERVERGDARTNDV